jgi:hypothetical protein
MDTALRCYCGHLQGRLAIASAAGRATCYCKGCQAYARFLGRHEDMLDRHGGTEIIATLPRRLRFTAGTDELACMSLSDTGLLRWYAACCNTAIGNTPRDPKTSYLGIVVGSLSASAAELDRLFGAATLVLNTQSARGEVPRRGSMFIAGLRIARNIIGSRISGKYRQNPLFDAATAQPVVTPRVLAPAERQALYVDG